VTCDFLKKSNLNVLHFLPNRVIFLLILGMLLYIIRIFYILCYIIHYSIHQPAYTWYIFVAGSYEVGMLIPHLPVVISYIKDRVSKATIKGTNQNAFPMKELNILSVYVLSIESLHV